MRNWLRQLGIPFVLLGSATCGHGSLPQSAGASIQAASSKPPPEGLAPSSTRAALRMALMRVRQTAPGHDFVSGEAGVLQSYAGDGVTSVQVRATERGVRLSRTAAVTASALELGVETTSLGRPNAASPLQVLDQHAQGQELVLTHETDVEERFLAGPLGLEQSYTLGLRPAGSGPLLIEVAFAGLAPELVTGAADRVLLKDSAGNLRGGYRDLLAVDADGRELPAHMDVRGDEVVLVIDDDGATYPVSIDPTVWTLQTELTATTNGAADGAAGDFFGESVAIDGTLAVVGAPNHAVAGNAGAGAAYIWVQSGTSWSLQQKITASDGAKGDAFGTSVAINGGTVVVGAPYHTVGTHTEAGAAYVFTQSGTTWTQQPDLDASDASEADGFGTSVAVSGTTVVVGAPFHDANGHSEAGAAYVFVQSGTTWSQQQEITADDGNVADLFGASVSVSDTLALVGAYQHDVAGVVSAGAAYVFAQSGTTWAQQQELTASDGAISDFFGYSVSLSGTIALVGAYQHDVGSMVSAGAAYVWVQSGTTWSVQQELNASDGATNDYFGYSVSVDTSSATALVGAYQHEEGTNPQAGAAYAFTQSGTTWTQQEELYASDGATNDFFGTSVGASGDLLIVGALQHTVGTLSEAGAAYVLAVGCDVSGTIVAAGGANPADACQICVPATSTTTYTSVADGATCTNANECDLGNTCQGGICTPTSTVTCVASDQCHAAGTCAPATGLCSNPIATNGTGCTSTNPCDLSNTCQNGVCTPGSTVTCTASDQCHSAGACNPANGMCSNPILSNGTICSDGSDCDLTTCQAGVCTLSGTVTCTAPDACHTAGVCNPASGTCSTATLNAGYCDIDGACVLSGAANGTNICETCQPATSTSAYTNVSNGTACTNTNPCDMNNACQAGVCTPGSTTTCTAPDACHSVGACNPANGSCPAPTLNAGFCDIGGACIAAGAANPANACQTCQPTASTSAYSNATGTACTSSNLCDLNNTCQAGVCAPGSTVTCTVSSQCQIAGSCSPATGLCSSSNAPDGTPCTGGACEGGTCVPSQTASTAGATSTGTTTGTTTASATTAGATTTTTGTTTASATTVGATTTGTAGATTAGASNSGSTTAAGATTVGASTSGTGAGTATTNGATTVGATATGASNTGATATGTTSGESSSGTATGAISGATSSGATAAATSGEIASGTTVGATSGVTSSGTTAAGTTGTGRTSSGATSGETSSNTAGASGTTTGGVAATGGSTASGTTAGSTSAEGGGCGCTTSGADPFALLGALAGLRFWRRRRKG